MSVMISTRGLIPTAKDTLPASSWPIVALTNSSTPRTKSCDAECPGDGKVEAFRDPFTLPTNVNSTLVSPVKLPGPSLFEATFDAVLSLMMEMTLPMQNIQRFVAHPSETSSKKEKEVML